jgi:hypothetical protein
MRGKPRAFVHFFMFVAILGLFVALESRTLDSVIAFFGLGFFVIGSIVALFRILKERGNPQASTFPLKYRRYPGSGESGCLEEVTRRTLDTLAADSPRLRARLGL